MLYSFTQMKHVTATVTFLVLHNDSMVYKDGDDISILPPSSLKQLGAARSALLGGVVQRIVDDESVLV